ncbi:MAG: hypothetical protein U0176_08030 [Bacteroidia bacterium]
MKKRGSIAFFAAMFAAASLFTACKKDKAPEGVDFREEMRTLVEEISTTARATDADFIVIPQNGLSLLSSDGETSGSAASGYISAISGVSQEDVNFGYEKDNVATPSADRDYLHSWLDYARAQGVTAMVTDYCSDAANINSSYSINDGKGYIGYAADDRELKQISSLPSPIHNENDSVITRLDQIRNYVYLINPENFATKQDYINAVTATNSTCCHGTLLQRREHVHRAEVEALRTKANGGRRLVISYMSIGEAEDYRYYWDKDWKFKNPERLRRENSSWKGNYKVWYGARRKSIIYSADSYLGPSECRV